MGPSGVCAGRVFYRYRPLRPRAGTVLFRKRLCMRDKVLPARVVGGESGKKFSLRAKSGPKSAFWGVPGEFCTGWAAEPGGRESFVPVDPVEPGSRASFVSLRARRGLHRAFLAAIDAPPIDAAVMRCRYMWARWPCPTGASGNRIPDPSVRSLPHASRPPTHHAGAGGIAKNVWGVSKRERHVER